MRPNYRRVDATASRAAPGDAAAPPQEQLPWLALPCRLELGAPLSRRLPCT